MHPLTFISVAAIFAASVAAQGVTLLSNIKTRPNLSGLYGYRAPDGTELALLGDVSGLAILDATDATAPVERAFFAENPSFWREVTTYGTYAYSVSEDHAGLMVIDLSDPKLPKKLGWVHTGSWPQAHTISVDPGTGRLYVNGTRYGMFVLDAKAAPTMPTILGLYTGDYVHDSHVRRNRGYLSEINRGQLRIVDASDPTRLTTLSITKTPGRFTHSSWVTDDDKLLLTTDENSTGFLQIYDIGTPGSPNALGSFSLTGAIVHNVHVLGRTAYLSYYTEGFQLVDLADPMLPRGWVSYDTNTAVGGLVGAWGCYPYQDSGVVYISDTTNGFFALQIDRGHLNRYGAGTAGTGGLVPRLQFGGATPAKGASNLRLELTNLAPNARFMLVISLAKASQQVLGMNVLVDLKQALFVDATADTEGKATIPFPIPSNNFVVTYTIYLQVIALDAAGPQGFAASRGMWFGICR